MLLRLRARTRRDLGRRLHAQLLTCLLSGLLATLLALEGLREHVTALRVGHTLWAMSALSALAAALLARGVAPPPPGTYDAIVVAGCRVLPSGAPSQALARRAELALRLYREGRAPRVVFTGGVGRHGPSEASVAAQHAVRAGLPAARVVLEERSTSTRENADFAAALIGPEARVLVVTDAYHVFRARRVFAQAFAQAEAAGVPLTGAALRHAVPRELIAVLIYGVRGDLFRRSGSPGAR